LEVTRLDLNTDLNSSYLVIKKLPDEDKIDSTIKKAKILAL
jgi:hypothetical protein